MQVPYLDNLNFILALVHHISVPNDFGTNKASRIKNEDERMFAFVLGLD